MNESPNLLLILTDHWRGDSLSRLGHPVADTPHLDSLSRGGTTFTRAYTPCPSCIAARRSLMTGMTPYSQGMIGYQDGKPWDYEHTLAGTLRDSGYQTVNVGKTHFDPPRLHLGFEQLTTSQDYGEWLARQQGLDGVEKFAHGVPANSWLARPNHLPEHQIEETWFTTQALDFLNHRDPTRPFFLCLSFTGRTFSRLRSRTRTRILLLLLLLLLLQRWKNRRDVTAVKALKLIGWNDNRRRRSRKSTRKARRLKRHRHNLRSRRVTHRNLTNTTISIRQKRDRVR